MKRCLTFLFVLLLSDQIFAQPAYEFAPQNPVNAAWLLQHLTPRHPRLLLPADLAKIRPAAQQPGTLTPLHYRYLLQNAEALLSEPVLERQQVGRRLLSVSREAVRRLGTLGLVYRISQDEKYGRRLEQELTAVCAFSDWNPSHFLDVAEMAYAVAIGLDWGYDMLPKATQALAKRSLVEKALRPSLPEADNGWMNSRHNWNQVCHGGLSVAALMVVEEEPELAAQVISRALDKLPLALAAYHPDGAYPEGASYWFYATYYTAVMISAFESALGTDFHLFRSPGLSASAQFSVLLAGPTGQYYDYFDAKEKGAFSVQHYDLLSWFAQRDTRYAYVDTARYRAALHREIAEQAECHRFAPAGFVWRAALDVTVATATLPEAQVYRGANPLVILRDTAAGPRGFYLGAKGGRAGLNHGNMDGGSFILELDGVRWSVDPGNQNYHDLEQIMGRGLWDRRQRGRRWTLLTKNNYGHSTLTVNDSLHRVDGEVPIVRADLLASSPSASFDLSEALDDVDRAVRTFTKVNGRTLRITDSLTVGQATRSVTWNLITRADVAVTDTGATLTQDGQQLVLEVNQPATFEVEVIPLSPPPLPYDKNLPGLKRIEVHVAPASLEKAPLEIELRGGG